MNQQQLIRELNKAADRHRRYGLNIALTICWLLAAALALTLWMVSRGTGWLVPGIAIALLVALPLVAGRLMRWSWRRGSDPLRIARIIERQFPDLDARLLTALEQHPDRATNELGFLQQTVIDQALAHARQRRWERIVSSARLGSARLARWAVAVIFLLLAGVIAMQTYRHRERGGWWLGSIGDSYDIKVEPEDTSIERGTSLLVMARFGAHLPSDVQLVTRDAAGSEKILPMSKSLDDPLFAARVPAVNQNLTYAVQYGPSETRWFKVDVFDYPELKQADVRLKFPTYTGLDEKLVQDTRSVTAVEGTTATITLKLNKTVKQATLSPRLPLSQGEREQEQIQLTADPNDPTVYSFTSQLTQSQRLRLNLVDEQGRSSKQPAELVVSVTPNKTPELKFTWPGRDTDVSPLQEIDLEARVSDDFGVKRAGVNYTMAGGESHDLVLAENLAANVQQAVSRRVNMEELAAEPDQLLSYYFWAEDVGPRGTVRRTSGDMFFAEVRPFEEIFRQGQQPADGEQQQQQQGGQNAQQAEELADLQKQIIAATWKLIRREVSSTLSAEFGSDVNLISESQASAREQAEQLGENLDDERSRAHLRSALSNMSKAIQQLDSAASSAAAAPLATALSAEQAAYQDLLKLRAREFDVVRGNRQRGQSSGSSARARRQQQLDQLELSNEENRYETQRQASAGESPQQRETRQVLSRLRELAQRQEDLNRQMRQLQSALEQARDEQQREEARRQLARLRDQQQQMLRDADELRDRMDQPQNQQQMADSRQQMEQTRENIRQASQSLEQGQVPQASAAGARAAEQLDNLREEFRRDASGQFSEAMNQMRQDARQLDQNQQQLSQQLQELDRGQQPALRDSGQRQQMSQELEQQNRQLNELTENMRQTVEQAETTEPLLSNQLYETLRQTYQQQTAEAMDATRQLLDRGFVGESRQAEQQATRGVSQLREGVERAAESVLGDEAESLRRARNELDELNEQLQQEIAANRPGGGQPATMPAGQQIAQGEQQPGDRPENSRQGQRDGAQQQQARAGAGQPSEQQEGDDAQPAQGGGNQQPQSRSDDAQQGDTDTPQAGLRGGNRQRDRDDSDSQAADSGGVERDPMRRFFQTGIPTGRADRRGPLTGDDFREWADRLRDVEEMVSDPTLRARAAQIRQRARGMRADFTRHSTPPNWDMVRETIGQPLAELRDQVAQELRRRQSDHAMVPLDREPVPPQYADQVRRYYERLGSGK